MWRKEWVDRSNGNDGVVVMCNLRNNRKWLDGALLMSKVGCIDLSDCIDCLTKEYGWDLQGGLLFLYQKDC